MSACEVCGNAYDKAFTVTMDGLEHTFDCFECAIHALAPACTHCGCRVIGHGVEEAGAIYCCNACVRHEDEAGHPDDNGTIVADPANHRPAAFAEPS